MAGTLTLVAVYYHVLADPFRTCVQRTRVPVITICVVDTGTASRDRSARTYPRGTDITARADIAVVTRGTVRCINVLANTVDAEAYRTGDAVIAISVAGAGPTTWD